MHDTLVTKTLHTLLAVLLLYADNIPEREQQASGHPQCNKNSPRSKFSGEQW